MTHKMQLNDVPFNKIKEGTKTIELRLNDEKRKRLKIGHYIEFTNRITLETMLIEIINLHKNKNFEELYKHFNKIELGYNQNDVVSPKDMEKYYPKVEQEKYGVLGIEIKKANL